MALKRYTYIKNHIGSQSRGLSLSTLLKKEGKINSEFELILSNLSLEDILALKIEQTAKVMHSFNANIPIFHTFGMAVQEAVLKYAFTVAKNKKDAAGLLGISMGYYKKLIRKYKINKQFKDLLYEEKKKYDY